MRPLLVLLGLTVLSSCDRIPFVRDYMPSKGPKRTTRALDVDCSGVEGRPPREDCVTKRLACGDAVKSTNAGGTSTYGDAFYRNKYCTPSIGGYDGPERIYLIDLPAYTLAELYLDGDCADLDLFAFRWTFEGTCPGMGHPITECEADTGRTGKGHVHLETVTRPAQYFVVVDGKGGITAPFGLTVECVSRQ